jgi:hypothetical protein
MAWSSYLSDVIIISYKYLLQPSSSNTNMNSLFRPILRSIVVRNTPLAIRPTAYSIRLGVTAATRTLLQSRTVASSVSMRPGSQTLEHAATNVKEELGNSATDLAKVISGANMTTDSVSDTESFVSRLVDVGLNK